ncbi:MAG TPA: 2-hydroxyacyl-CoA dehydratase family protein [Myxococcota bacterium]|nr:2-hydroxyacyl-CoA dehydratase family protein [Myxococcota bacterium]
MKQIIDGYKEALAGYPQAEVGAGKRIGYLCSYVPQELLTVPGLEPYSMHAPQCAGTDLADTYMGRVTCSYMRCILEAFEEDRYEYLDGFVMTTGCDHMRRLHDNLAYLRKPDFLKLLDVPHKVSPAAIDWYTEELRRLADDLAEAFDLEITDALVRESIGKWNQARRLMVEIDRLRRADAPPLSGSEMIALSAGFGARPIEANLRDLERLLDEARRTTDCSRAKARARLLLVSSQLDDIRYVEALEAGGGLLVGEIGCTAASSFEGQVDEQAEPFRALARRYLERLPCPRMMEEHSRLLERIVEMRGERRADGVIIVALKFCDSWAWEGTLLLRELREAGVPVLRLEREYFFSGEGQVATRVQAFLESMGK